MVGFYVLNQKLLSFFFSFQIQYGNRTDIVIKHTTNLTSQEFTKNLIIALNIQMPIMQKN